MALIFGSIVFTIFFIWFVVPIFIKLIKTASSRKKRQYVISLVLFMGFDATLVLYSIILLASRLQNVQI